MLVIDLIMLSKILRLFVRDKKIESSNVVQNGTLTTKELPQILDKTNIGLIVLDVNDCITQINSVSSMDLNIPKGYEGSKLVEVFNNGEIINLIKSAKVDRSAEEEIFGVDPGNKSFLVNATYDYESLETTLVFIDITRIRKLENIRKDFIANLSHELRTPVAVIRANSESLVDGALDDKEIAQKFSNAILKNSEKLSYLLEDILNLSTIESGEYNLELAENNISEIFKTSINSVLSNNPDVKIINNISSDIKVICDIKALVQVIDNLIENSVKYGITEESKEIIINMKDQGSKVRFEIEDHGHGISADQRERVFERFFRIQNNNTSLKEGTGLGLSIVKNLVNLMGGSVGNEKAYPEGTIFWFTLNKKKLIFFPNLFLLRNTNVTFTI